MVINYFLANNSVWVASTLRFQNCKIIHACKNNMDNLLKNLFVVSRVGKEENLWYHAGVGWVFFQVKVQKIKFFLSLKIYDYQFFVEKMVVVPKNIVKK